MRLRPFCGCLGAAFYRFPATVIHQENTNARKLAAQAKAARTESARPSDNQQRRGCVQASTAIQSQEGI
jgi:hypothetical protein